MTSRGRDLPGSLSPLSHPFLVTPGPATPPRQPKKMIGWCLALFAVLGTAAVAVSSREQSADASSRKVDTRNSSISTPTGSHSPSVQSKDGCTIRVTGTDGLPFQGSYAAVETWGSLESKSVEGTVPATYPVKGMTVATFFEKKGNPGSLRVEILKNGSVIKRSETKAAQGAVTVATP
jgi:hypothetical protein